MSGHDGLYLGVALLGGAFLLSQSEDGITGGGLGETIREQIESVIAVPQVLKETTERIADFDIPDFDLSGLIPEFPTFPSNDEIITAAGNAGTTAGSGIGAALGSAFLNGFTGLYKGAGVAGAHFVGRDDVTLDNVFSEFSKSLNGIKASSLESIYTGVPAVAGGLAKGVLFGGDAGEAARILSGSSNGKYSLPTATQNTRVSNLITGAVSSKVSRRSSSGNGDNGSAKLAAYKNATGSAMSRKAIQNTAGIHSITRTLKKVAGEA